MALDVDRYLARIGYAGGARPDLATLAALQRAHMATVPFENLDVYYGPGVEIGADWALDKVLERRRGGWCFELNTAFGELLAAIGFDVVRLAAEVLFDGEPPPSPDHLTLMVNVAGERYLVDVGFGDSFCRPLRLDDGVPQDGETGTFRLREATGDDRDAGFVVLEAEEDGAWARHHRFRPEPVELDVFEPASRRLQDTEGLHWTETRFATRLFERGRVTLLHDRLKLIGVDGVEERPVDEHEWHRELERWFGWSGFAPVDR